MSTQPSHENRTAARSLARGIALVGSAVLVGALALVGPASAGTSVGEGFPPSGPGDGGSVSVPAAVTPTTTPAVPVHHVGRDDQLPCAVGNFCAAVWDPANQNWAIFSFSNPGTYTLHNWLNQGVYSNVATSLNVTFNGTTKRLTTSVFGDQNWTPVSGFTITRR